MRKGANRVKDPESEHFEDQRSNLKRKHSQTIERSEYDAKKVKLASKPKPEYFEDQGNLEDLWKAAFLVGTEWDQIDSVYQINWDFSNLENAFEEGGELHDKQVYLFGCTEPQMVSFKGEKKIMFIPAIVAVVSPFPPSDKIGITSVQRETEEIVPMKQMKMDWFPYFPLEKRDSQVERTRPKVFILGCSQRKSSLKLLEIERVKKYEYCLPYYYHPFKKDKHEQFTEVQIVFPGNPRPVHCEFNLKVNKLEEFTDTLIKEGELDEDEKDAFKKFVEEKVEEAEEANRAASEARKKALEEMSEETKLAFKNIKFYKFYPVQTPDCPDIHKASYINRYYGKADKVL